MKRWIVTLSFALAQCPEIGAAAELPSGEMPVASSPAHDSQAAGGWTVAPVKSRKANKVVSDCSGGKRIISAFYWEGKRTASGQPFNPRGMTAAHRTLPFGTHVTVSNPRTGKSVTVVINDRGPYTHGVSLDLSLGAAKAIGMQGTGALCLL